MLDLASQSVRGGCMMILREQDSDVLFRGTGFIVHPEGYLFTAAHILDGTENLMAVAPPTGGYEPLHHETVTPLPVSVVAVDAEHDVALLKLDGGLDIVVPDHLLARREAPPPGRTVLALGYTYGHHQIHNLMGTGAYVSSNVLSRNGTRLIMYDRPAHWGDRGGPLVDGSDGRIVGIVGGTFNPDEAGGTGRPELPSNHAYAIAIEYGIALAEGLGLQVP